jgi:putative oxidoreductase
MDDQDGRSVTASDVGLLILRIGTGIMYVYHGYPKMFGGHETWTHVGAAMSTWGISFAPAFWGFMASFSEFFGGIFILLGLAFRPYCSLLTVTMLVATSMLLAKGDGLTAAAYPLTMAVVFLSLIFIGPGRLSLDALCRGKE